MKRGTIIRNAEEEFGQPFMDVVLGFAEDGESIHATSKLLGYSSPTPFKRWVKKHGLEGRFKKGEDCLGRIASRESYVFTEARRKALELAGPRNPTYRVVEHDGIVDTLAGHARRVGLNARTVYCRIYAGRSVEDALKKTNYVKSPSTKKHIWRTAFQPVSKGADI